MSTAGVEGRSESSVSKLRAGRYLLLEYAVIVSWEELMQAPRSGLIHLEYRTGADSSLESLRVLSSRSRGYWKLVCEYWMNATSSHPRGMRFHHGYHSENLAELLSFVMQHQDEFSSDSGPCREGLLQIGPPSELEEARAASCLREVIEGLTPLSSAKKCAEQNSTT